MRTLSGSMVFGAGLLALAGLSGTAKAAVIVQGPGQFGAVKNVIFANCTGVAAGSVSGCLQNDRSYMVHFESNEPLTAPSQGQARVEDLDGDGFDYLKIWADTDFTKLVTNINSDGDGSVLISVYVNDLLDAQGTFALGSGQNFFQMTADIGELISYVTFEAIGTTLGSILFEDFRQTRLATGDDPDDPQSVSEPATIALFGLSLLGLGLAARRRRLL